MRTKTTSFRESFDAGRSWLANELRQGSVSGHLSCFVRVPPPAHQQLHSSTIHKYFRSINFGIMAVTVQRVIISVLLILTATFLFVQSTEAAKGPKITHKVIARTYQQLKALLMIIGVF